MEKVCRKLIRQTFQISYNEVELLDRRKYAEIMREKTVITICLGSSCYRRGNQTILEVIKNYLTENNLSNDVEFKGQLCTGKCTEGPHISIDGTDYSGLDLNSCLRVLNKHFLKD